MKLSVILPAFNAQEHIRACLQSLIAQKNWKIGRDYEIIVVDDGSTDETVKIARSFPVRIIRLKKNQGRITARQKGAEAAKAPQLLFIDSRVAIAPDFFDILDHYLQKHSCILAGGYTLPIERLHWSRLFALVRQKWYGDRFWPTPRLTHWITKENFTRTPKGMGVFCLPAAHFWKIQPKDHARWQNDDTKLLSSLVFEQHIPILRVAPLRWEYTIRKNWLETLTWLFDRGTYFASYYFQPKHPFFATLTGGSLFFLFLTVLVFTQTGFTGIFLSWFMLLLFLAFYLAKRVTDIAVVLFHLPIMIFFFGLGIIRYWWVLLLHTNQKSWLRAGISLVILGIFAFTISSNRETFYLLKDFTPGSILPLVIVYSLFLAMNGLFLRVILEAFKVHLDSLTAVAISNLSTIGNTFLPARGGAAWRATYLRSRFSLSFGDFLATLTAGYFITFNVNAGFALIALLIWWIQGGIFPLNLFFLFFTIWMGTGLSMFFPHFWLQKKQQLPSKISQGLKGWLILTQNKPILGKLFLISVANVLISATLLWQEYQALHLTHISLIDTTILSSTASLGLFFSLTPAALGIREGLLMITAQLIDVNATETLVVGLLDRAISLLTLTMVSIPSFAWLLRKNHSETVSSK